MASISTPIRGIGREYFDLFERAGANLERAGVLLDEMLGGFPDSQELAHEILACEGRGDQITRELITRLNQSFVAPIHRQDILDLASALDDIVDYAEEVAAYLGLYKVEAPMTQAQTLAHILRKATWEIALAIPLLRGFGDVSEHTAEVRRLENAGDRVVRRAIASLFEERIDPLVVIRWMDIFERLEEAIDSTERAANIMDGIAIKNAGSMPDVAAQGGPG